jgi:anti-sigma factor RsiW
MMNYESQLKLQSYLDGELSETQTREVAKWLAQDQDAVGLLAELRNTRQALANTPTNLQLPESREFFWSKIQRDILRQQPPQIVPEKRSLLTAWRRFLVPASAVAALLIVALLAIQTPHTTPETETALDSGAFTYHDYNAGATLVWVSYPAENEIAQTAPVGTVQ